jgi:hypothetical protein
VSDARVKVPTFEEIELRAYDIYFKRGDGDGVALERFARCREGTIGITSARRRRSIGETRSRILTFGEPDSWIDVLRLAALVSVRQCT